MKQPIKKTDRKKVVISDAFRIHPSKNTVSTDKRRTAKMLAAKRAKAKAAKRAQEAVQNHQINYVVVHSIGNLEKISIPTLDKLKYDTIISSSGRFISKSTCNKQQGTIEIGLVGGYDKQGNIEDNHSEQQKNVLIDMLMDLLEKNPDILIKRADELYSNKKSNPSFSLDALVIGRILDAFKNLFFQQRA